MSDTYLDYGLTRTCNGTGWLTCRCGGDACFCSRQGEAECFGCEDCDPPADEYTAADFERPDPGARAWCPVCRVWHDPTANDGYGGCDCS